MNQSFRFKPAEIGKFSAGPDECLKQFSKDCRIMGMTMGDFSLIDIIHSTLKKTGPANVVIATWSAGIKDAHQVKWMVDTDLITNLHLLTDHSYKTRQSKYAATIEELFGKENIRTSEMHAKFVLIGNDEYKVAILSSMNLNANKTCEIFEIEEGEAVYAFLKEFVLHHFDNMEHGFIASSEKVTKCVESYFNAKQIVSTKHWSDE